MGKRIITDISKEECCEKTKTPPDCWIFNEAPDKEHRFWVDQEEPREDWYYLDNGTNTIYRFADMAKYGYGEIWMSKTNKNEEKARWSMWSTWEQYD